MKRLLLPSAFLITVATFACRDTPVDPSARSEHSDLSAVNPSPPHAANSVRLDLGKRLKPRPASRSLSGVASNIVPASFAAALAPGQTASDVMSVNLPAAPPKGDVLFLFDLTGSMGGALTNLKLNAVDIMNAVGNVIPDVNFGLISHEDYPLTLTTSTAAGQACNYGPVAYGGGSDLAYRRDQPITSVPTAVTTAIDAMTLKGGGDGPESYSRALYETYADPTIAWRSGAKRVVVSFADNVPHDCDYDFANVLSPKPAGTGNDPGRDNAIGTSDDLRIKNVLDGMAANGITLVTIHNGSRNTLWNSYAAVTGGSSFQTNANGTFPTGTSPATTIASLISGSVRTLSSLTMEVCSSHAATYGEWLVSTSPTSYSNVTLGESRGFTAVVGPPPGKNLVNGVRTFDLCAMGDGVEYGRQHVTITSEGTTTFVPANSAEPTTVTVVENGKAVAGIQIPAGTFGQAVAVTVRFVPLAAGASCHAYLLAQTGRCLEITAKNAAGADVVNAQPMTVGLCLSSAPGPRELFKFEERTATPFALKQVDAPFLNCEGFTYGSAQSPNGFGELAKALATRVAGWVTPKPLYAAHGGFGGLILEGDGLSLFTWASPIQISLSGLAVNVQQTGKDAFALTGTFDLAATGLAEYSTESGFDPARDEIRLAFGRQQYTIGVNAFRYSTLLKRWLYAAKTDAGITAMSIDPVGGKITLAATAPTEGALPTYRPFSLRIGHRAQGVGLDCDSRGVCVPQERP